MPKKKTDDELPGVLGDTGTEPVTADDTAGLDELVPDETGADTDTSLSNPDSAYETPDPDAVGEDDSEAEPKPAKKIRATRKKADAPPSVKKKRATPVMKPTEENYADMPQMKPPTRRRSNAQQILTIDAKDEVEMPAARDDAVWHEIQNARRTHKPLTGTLGGIERNDAKQTTAIVYYKDIRVAIPLKEMHLTFPGMENLSRADALLRQDKLLNNMLGAEIDFTVLGIDSKTRSVVGSRKEAMLKKRQTFYFGTDSEGVYRLYEGRVVQARVVAVAVKGIRVEVFGVECSIGATGLAWDWIVDAHESFSVGDEILVRILRIRRESLEDIVISADVRSVTGESGRENLKKCHVQGKYAGTVTDIHKGVVFIRLSIGVNAVAHSCLDSRTPGKKDTVSFAVTHIDEDRNVAVGIITRIIKQNI